MQIVQEFYDLFPQTIWENDAEELRAKALNRLNEARIKQLIVDYQQTIIALKIDEPGPDGEVRKANLNLMQGKLLALQELLEDSRNAHGALNLPNE